MNALDLIGLSILSIRYHFIPQNSAGLQEFHTYLKLSNGRIANIPVWPDELINEDVATTSELLQKYITGNKFEPNILEKVENQAITDLYFRKDNGLFSKPAFIELGNTYYLTEEIYASSTEAICLKLYDKDEFLEEDGWQSYAKGKGGTP